MDEYARFREQLDELVTADHGAVATKAIGSYFASDGPGFTGSQFELVTDSEAPNAITARDIVAVSMLSVSIPPRPARWLLSDEGRMKVAALLEQVPMNVKIYEPEADALLAPGGPLWDLWDLLKTANWPMMGSGNGLGRNTRRSKLLHAKRPHLVPIYDSVVDQLLPTSNHWEAFRRALSDPRTRTRIEQVTSSAPSHLSLLRRVDIVLWWIGNRRAMQRDGEPHRDLEERE
jgi:hypothetical protein